MSAQTQRAGKARVLVVKSIIASPRYAHRHAIATRELFEVATHGIGGDATAEDYQRPLGLIQAGLDLFELRCIEATALHRPRRLGHRKHLFTQHVFRQRQHHRPGSSAARDVEGAHHRTRQGLADGYLLNVLGKGCKERFVVDFLKGLTSEVIARHLADTQQQWYRGLPRNM